MRFKLSQPKFKTLLEKLVVKDIFGDDDKVVISVKNGRLYSIQQTMNDSITRYAKFEKSYFDEIDDSNESIEFNAYKLLKLVEHMKKNSNLVVETVGKRIKVTQFICKDGKETNIRGYAKVLFTEPEKVMHKLPFEMKDGTPYFTKEKIPLDVHFTVNLEDLKRSTIVSRILSTRSWGKLKDDYYTFIIENKKLSLRTGGLHDFNDYDVTKDIGTVFQGNDIKVILTWYMRQLVDTFKEKYINVKTRNNAPVWMYEGTDDYLFGLLMPSCEGAE